MAEPTHMLINEEGDRLVGNEYHVRQQREGHYTTRMIVDSEGYIYRPIPPVPWLWQYALEHPERVRDGNS
jgi:hypothetical protein